MPKVQLEDGTILEFAKYPTPEDIDFAVSHSAPKSQDAAFTEAKIQAPASSTPESKPQVQEQNILGQIFNVPAATSRAAIQSNPALAAAGPLAGLLALSGLGGKQAQQAAGMGAAQPDSVPTFQALALKNASPKTESVAANFVGGLPASVGGLAADMAVDPANVLASIIMGIKPGKVQPIEQVVDKDFSRAIPTSMRGVKRFRNIEEGKVSARSAVESIVDNKANLVFDDGAGEIAKGRLPQNMDEFTQSISQTKKTIFNKYEALRKEAGEAGLTIPLKPIAKEIEAAVSSPHIKDISPAVQNYGASLAKRLEVRGTYSLAEAQDVVEALTKNLKGYFRDPTPQAIHQAVIDSAVLNHIRRALLKAVESKSGTQYEILRRQYGHLSAVEEGVTKAAVKASGERGAGLGRLFDIYSSGDIVNGLYSMNPHLVAKGAFQISARRLFSFLKDPNRIVKNMFNNVDRIKNIDPAKRQLKEILMKVAKSTAVGSAEALAP